jgi:hypothetical protein
MEALGNEINDFFETHLCGVINQIDIQLEEKKVRVTISPNTIDIKEITVIRENGFHTNVAKTFLKNVQRDWPM